MLNSHMALVLKYSFFAAISIAANLLAQYIFLLFYDFIFPIILSVFFGTGVGLVLKFYLDKKFIFFYQDKSKTDTAHKFALYTLMGVLTTAIFWGFEFGFEVLFETDLMRYFGGFVGLTIGYIIKYQMDKKFVFVNKE